MGRESSGNQGGDLHSHGPYFQALLNDPHVLLALLEVDGTIKHVNRAALDVVSADETDIIGAPFWEGPWWKHSKKVRDDFQWRVERAATGEYVEFEAEYATGDNERRLTTGMLRPVMDDGEVISIIASGRDITDQVHQQQQLDVFQRILRHNLRNSLNIIEGYSEEITSALSKSGREKQEIEKMAQSITDQSKELNEVVAKIQWLEQHDRGHRIPIQTLFARVTEEIQEKYPDCRITTTIPQTDIDVPTAFTMAVTEGIINASKYHPQSDPTIELTANIVTDTDPPQVQLCIADDGPGIPPSEVEPVLQGEETALIHTSGVGLWLIKWIVEQHGGDLSISNDPQESRMMLTFPIQSL